MMHSMWLAGVFGPFLLIRGLWMLICRSAVMKTESAVKSSAACFHIIATVQLLVGLAIVNTCCSGPFEKSVWLLALLGWVMIIRGVLSFFMPKLVLKTVANPKWSAVTGLIALLWGFAISWSAFM